MDSTPSGLDFAIIGHQDSWSNIGKFINSIRAGLQEPLSLAKIKDIFSFVPPTDLFRVKVKSKTGKEINGVYIETFIDPDKLDHRFVKTNISKVKDAASHAVKMGAGIVAFGGFTSIVLEGNVNPFSAGETKFTTGNTLTAAYIVKGIEQAAALRHMDLQASVVLVVGATGDIGIACVNQLKYRVKKILLCARNVSRLKELSTGLEKEKINVEHSHNLEQLVPEADVIICAASSTGIELVHCKKGALICDAGYPRNLDTKIEDHPDISFFHGGMGQVSMGYVFTPDYSRNMYKALLPNIIHGCILEAMVLAFENRFESYSRGKGNITIEKMEEIYNLGIKHGIALAPFYNAKGLWPATDYL
jgi:fatty aldehyde-generating acyl-ACP reductase